MNSRKHTLLNLKKAFRDENFQAAMRANLCDMYIDMFTVSKYISMGTTAYSIPRRFCHEELKYIIPPELSVKDCRSVMVKVKLKDNRSDIVNQC